MAQREPGSVIQDQGLVTRGTSQEVCAKCGTRLVYMDSVVEDDGTLYCCGNCFAHATRPIAQLAGTKTELCAHCGLALVDKSTRVQRGVRVYCCMNCADAFEHVGPPA
ncbi:MAG TPA: hypothetical protein VFD70_06900 [Anaerolineae bacterium]|nr:hypothetical protein [Anaerolineae bacterium]